MSDIQKKTILAVDDNPSNIQIILSALRADYNVRPFTSGRECLDYFSKGQSCDLILLDIQMPEFSGFDTIRVLKSMPQVKNIPVVFLTGVMDTQSEVEGLSLGAVDYIYKPFNPVLLKKRIEIHIALEEYSNNLEQLVQRKTETIEKLNHVTVSTIISVIGTRDQETNGHINRTSAYVMALAKTLRERGLYLEELTDENVEQLRRSAPLHDMGKVGIRDAILNKPGKLTAEEFADMKRHTTIGGDAFHAARLMMNEASFLDFAEQLARSHHEKWDGSGYPDGLSGTNIPLAARIMALADVYDALISKRPYKSPMSHETAVQIIKEGRGIHFDPMITDAFLLIEQSFNQIAQTFKDEMSPIGRPL
jgi:Response regulator containing a CheY-like receiver domain and an HD-GYP domain